MRHEKMWSDSVKCHHPAGVEASASERYASVARLQTARFDMLSRVRNVTAEDAWLQVRRVEADVRVAGRRGVVRKRCQRVTSKVL